MNFLKFVGIALVLYTLLPATAATEIEADVNYPYSDDFQAGAVSLLLRITDENAPVDARAITLRAYSDENALLLEKELYGFSKRSKGKYFTTFEAARFADFNSIYIFAETRGGSAFLILDINFLLDLNVAVVPPPDTVWGKAIEPSGEDTVFAFTFGGSEVKVSKIALVLACFAIVGVVVWKA